MTTCILMIGPMSTRIGGATVLFRQLVADMQTRTDVTVTVVDTSCRSSSGVSAISRVVGVLLRTVMLIWRNDVVSLHVSSMKTALFAMLLWPILFVTRRAWVLRIFGNASVKHRKTRVLYRGFFDWLVRRCPLLLVETRAAEEYFRPRCRRVGWYPNNRPILNTALLQEGTSAVRFVFVGHVKPSKGMRDVIAAASMLGCHITVDVYGPVMDGIRAEELHGPVRYHGSIDPADVPAVLADHDVLLLPTHCTQEGYPGVILEAFAAGLPVIASRCEGTAEIVTDENGILVEPRDTLELVAAMQYFIQRPDELQRMRAGAMRSALRFDSAIWTHRFVQLVTDLVAEQRGQPSLATSSAKWN